MLIDPVVGVHWILGSWYKPSEIGKRTAIFTSSGLAGTMFSGFLQGAIYTNLDGSSGLAGWRWLFIIDFLITLPIALYGFLFFPDTPTSTRARYLNPLERNLAVERLPEVDTKRGVLGLSLFRRVVLSWHWWAFVLLWIANSNTEMYSSNAIFQLYLTSTGKYPVAQVCPFLCHKASVLTPLHFDMNALAPSENRRALLISRRWIGQLHTHLRLRHGHSSHSHSRLV